MTGTATTEAPAPPPEAPEVPQRSRGRDLRDTVVLTALSVLLAQPLYVVLGERNTHRYPPYHRLDLTVRAALQERTPGLGTTPLARTGCAGRAPRA